MDGDIRSRPVERAWEAPESVLVQAVAGGLDADAEAILPEEDGVGLDRDFWGGVEGRAGFAPASSLRLDGGLQFVPEASRVADVQLTRAEISWNGERHRWSAGRSTMRWGAGGTGSLLLGRTAPPRWQVRWRTERALALPAVGGRRLGTWSGSAFLAYLDDFDRRIPEPLLFGQRVSYQPTAWLEVTGTRTIILGGRGRTDRLTPRGILDILLARNENLRGARPPSDSDQRASLEIRLRPPVERIDRRWTGFEAFWEYAGEDVNDPPLPSAVAHHWGLLTRVHGWTALFEAVETVTGVNRWYDHTVYGRPTYVHRGFGIGHRIGGDAEMWQLAVWSPPATVRVRAILGGETFGVETGESDRRRVLELGAIADAAPDVTVELRGRAERRVDGERARRAPEIVGRRAEIRLTWSPRRLD